MYFLQFIIRYGFDINPGDRCILAKKGQNCNEKSHTETSYIYMYFDNAFINTDSWNYSEINRVFLMILVETSDLYVGRAKMTKKGVLNQ